MHANRLRDIMRLWNRASIKNQHLLIRRFQAKNGRNNRQRDIWMNFLAEEFSIPDYSGQQLQM